MTNYKYTPSLENYFNFYAQMKIFFPGLIFAQYKSINIINNKHLLILLFGPNVCNTLVILMIILTLHTSSRNILLWKKSATAEEII